MKSLLLRKIIRFLSLFITIVGNIKMLKRISAWQEFINNNFESKSLNDLLFFFFNFRSLDFLGVGGMGKMRKAWHFNNQGKSELNS